MIATFTYALPNEMWVSGISTTQTATYTYDGPELLDVYVTKGGSVHTAGVGLPDPPAETEWEKKTLDAKEADDLPVLMYMLQSYKEVVWDYTYTEETLSNGEKFKKVDNPQLKDNYLLEYDHGTNKFKFDQVVVDQTNVWSQKAQVQKAYIESYANKYAFSSATATAVNSYMTELDTFIGNNPPMKHWKFINQPIVGSMPKLPITAVTELKDVPDYTAPPEL